MSFLGMEWEAGCSAALRRIGHFEDMGMGGFHMHVHTEIDTDYMLEEVLDIVRSCVYYAKSKKMLACL